MLSNFGKSAIALAISAAIGSVILPAQSALLVSSSGDNSIKQYDEITGAYIRDFVTSGSGGLLNPQGLAFGPDGNLYVSSQRTNSVKKYSGTTGDYIGDFVSFEDGLSSPIGLTVAEDGSVFVVSSTIPRNNIEDVERRGVLQYNGTTGELLGSIPAGTSDFNPIPIDVVVGGSDNNVFFSQSSRSFSSGEIQQYDPTTNNSTNLDVMPKPLLRIPFEPRGLALKGNNLFFTSGREVGLLDLTTDTLSSYFVDTDSGGLNSAVDLTVGEDGSLYVSNASTNSIKKYNGVTGDFLGDFVTSNSGGLSGPTYLTTANVPVPEPNSVIGLLAFSGLFAGKVVRNKMNGRRQRASLLK